MTYIVYSLKDFCEVLTQHKAQRIELRNPAAPLPTAPAGNTAPASARTPEDSQE